MMSNEEFDRKMEFLLNQQARFDARFEADMQALREARKDTDEKVKHMFDGFEEAKELTIQTREDLAELTSLTTEGFKILYEQSRNTDAKIAALVKAQIETEEMVRNTDAQLQETDAQLQATGAQIRETGAQLQETGAQIRETDAQLQATSAQIRETDAQLQATSAQIRETDAIVRNIGVKFDRHLREDHNSG